MWRKVAKVGAVKADRNRSRSEPKAGVSCTCGLLVARGPGRGATSRIPPRRKGVAIPHAYPAPGKSAKPERSDGDLFAPGNPVESPGEKGLRLEGANSFHAASRPRRRAFSLRRRVLGRRGSGHRAGWYIWSTDAPERRGVAGGHRGVPS